MKDVEQLLPANLFSHVHKSFIVSIAKLDSIEGNCIKIAGTIWNGSFGRCICKSIKKTGYSNQIIFRSRMDAGHWIRKWYKNLLRNAQAIRTLVYATLYFALILNCLKKDLHL